MKSTPTAAKLQKANETGITFKKPGASTISNTKGLAFNSLIKRKQPLVVLKPKTAAAEVPPSSSEGNSKTTTAAKDQSDNAASSSNKAPTSNSNSGVGGLSLLSAYSDSSSEESNWPLCFYMYTYLTIHSLWMTTDHFYNFYIEIYTVQKLINQSIFYTIFIVNN